MADERQPARFRPGADTVTEPLGNELVLVHVTTDRIFLLNGTGARVWQLLVAGHDVGEVQSRLREEFEDPEATLETDIRDLIVTLRNEQLISPDG